MGRPGKSFSGDGGIFRTYFQGKCVQCLEIVPVGRTLYETGWLWFDSEHYFHGKYQPSPNMSAYASSKAALNHMTANLAMDFGPDVRINAVGPGAVEMQALASVLTPEIEKKCWNTRQSSDWVKWKILLGQSSFCSTDFQLDHRAGVIRERGRCPNVGLILSGPPVPSFCTCNSLISLLRKNG